MYPNIAVTLKINGGSLGPCSCATWCYCAGAYGLNELLVRTSGGLCRTNLFQYRPLVDVLLNNYGKEKHVCARWSWTASERNVLMHLSKVDPSAASLSVSHTPLPLPSWFRQRFPPVLRKWQRDALWHVFTVAGVFLSNPAHMEQPSDNCSGSPRGIMTVAAVDIPDYWQSWHLPPTHTCHTVSAGRHVRPQTDWTKVLLVPSLTCGLYLVTMSVFFWYKD